MRYLLIVPILLLATSSLAQERNYTLTLSSSELNKIMEAVADLKWKEANPLIFKVQQQVAEQNKPEPPKVEPKKEETDAPK